MDELTVAEAGLNERQKAFCEEYLNDYNATAAYRRAGYNVSTEMSAAVSASQLLRQPKIKLYIRELRRERAKDLMSKDELIDLVQQEAAGTRPDTNPHARVLAVKLAAELSGYVRPDAQKVDIPMGAQSVTINFQPATK